ncbi:MAG TPA: hypothetical protein VFL38_08960 [Humibacillus xanthopallidus]|nr:hypothetical protein [Humibacillus xanthopallidus]
MSKVITTKSPVFWLIVCAGVVLPALTLSGTARAVVTSAVVALVVLGLIRARRQERAATGRR